MRSYHGKRLDALAVEVRKLLVKFPNTDKIVFDHRGLGDAFPQFLSQPWTDPETNKEYPPLVIDTEASMIRNALPILRPIIASVSINQQMISAMTIALEQGSIELPISSRMILDNRLVKRDDDEEDSGRNLTMEEKAIFIEADALQVEMGNIISKETGSGAIIYDVAKSTQHKDRYSSLAMGLKYISELEDKRKRKIAYGAQVPCIGIVTTF